MQQAVIVEGLEGEEDGDGDRRRLIGGQTLSSRQTISERLAEHELADHEAHAVVRPGVEETGEVRIRDASERPGGLRPPFYERRIVTETRMDQLDDHGSLQHAIRGSPHDADAAPPEFLLEHVPVGDHGGGPIGLHPGSVFPQAARPAEAQGTVSEVSLAVAFVYPFRNPMRPARRVETFFTTVTVTCCVCGSMANCVTRAPSSLSATAASAASRARRRSPLFCKMVE